MYMRNCSLETACFNFCGDTGLVMIAQCADPRNISSERKGRWYDDVCGSDALQSNTGRVLQEADRKGGHCFVLDVMGELQRGRMTTVATMHMGPTTRERSFRSSSEEVG